MQRSSVRLISYKGTPLARVPAAFQTTIETASKSVETKYPKVMEARIQGSEPHKSNKDKSDTKDVITVSYHTAQGTRIISVHAHDDNTWKEFASRNQNKGK